MSVGSVLKKIGAGAASVGGSVAKEILGTGAPAPMAEAPAAAPAAAPQPFKLPDLDPNDPDYEEKKMIHDTYTKLGEALTGSAADDGIDLKSKYEELAKYAESRPQPKKWSPFSAFAIAMGSPDAMHKVNEDNAKADKAHSDREEYLLGLREQALKGEIAQLMQKGNFKKALTQSAALEELSRIQKLRDDARAGKQKLAEIEETNKGRAQVAGIRAAAAQRVAETKVNDLIKTYKLDAKLRTAMLGVASKFMSGLQAQKDAAGEPIYDEKDLHGMLEELVDYAEEHSPLFVESPTGVAPAPAPSGKAATPAAAAGPKPNDDVAAAFARRRAARAAAQQK